MGNQNEEILLKTIYEQALVGTGMSRARNSRWGMLLHVKEAAMYGGCMEVKQNRCTSTCM